MQTGTIAAAKVSKTERRSSRLIRPNSSESSIFDREIQFLKDMDHPNIIRFIGLEVVSLHNDVRLTQVREVVFLEFCNGGSLSDVLQQPANRFGLPEDTILQLMKDIIGALRYLYERQIIHRDIKPDNILQSIEINGKITYKLADLGVARRINPNELSSDSICGTVEYVHPTVFIAYYNKLKQRKTGKSVESNRQFYFEVEMWSFGVTIYQCATGRIPFQPFEGTRADQETMVQILSSIPPRHISGIQLAPKGEIEWSKNLPGWCRLSPNLKDMLESLLARLFETNEKKLMKHGEFFDEVDKILSFVPIYYLNLKRLTSTCTYIHKDQPINKLIDQIRQENGDDDNVEYFCLFQNVHYPISKQDNISVKTFYEQLPVEPSVDKLLVIYTYSTLQFDTKLLPKVSIPDSQPMKKMHDIFYSVYEWSKNIVGHLFYVKNQLIEYEFILQITQSSIRTINRSLKTKLYRLLCLIRNDLGQYQGIYELDQIANLMGLLDQEINDGKENSDILQTLRSSMDFYRKLTEYDRELTNTSEEYFNEQFTSAEDDEKPFNTYKVLKQIATFSTNIQRTDKYIDQALDLNDKFKRDTLVERATSLHMLSHSIRKIRINELQGQFIQLIHQDCYSIICDIFSKYRHWIQLQAKINNDIEAIQTAYQNQSNTIVSIDDLRSIVSDQLQKLNANEQTSSTTTYSSFDVPSTPSFYGGYAAGEATSLADRAVIRDVTVTIQKTIKEAQTNAIQMNDAIRQLQQLLKT